MDKAKIRLLAGAAGIFLAFCGLVALAISAVLALMIVMDALMATLIVGGVFLLISAGCFVFFLAPGKPIEAELEQAEELGSEALADLPVDTLKNFVRRHPMVAATVAAGLGYGMIKDPNSVMRHAQHSLLRML